MVMVDNMEDTDDVGRNGKKVGIVIDIITQYFYLSLCYVGKLCLKIRHSIKLTVEEVKMDKRFKKCLVELTNLRKMYWKVIFKSIKLNVQLNFIVLVLVSNRF
ncbi:hypothetical protein PV327_003737 [Microctonus hyperodae]|uniref:Transmembrane protein n=1 Tax=Microctonus hyperodae TaxID=165561 RepID=A0AA39L1C9_MICHY|nr:hypothetical protein PV327_003737 [Microctonus hyperodae]